MGNLMIEYSEDQLGRGYKSCRFETTANTALTSVAQTHTSNTSIVSFDATMATDFEQLTAKLSVSAQAQGAVLGAKVGGAASLLTSTSYSSNQSYVVASVDVKTQSVALDLSLQVATDLDALSFVEKFGDYFVGSIQKGGHLTLMVTATYSDQETKIAADASLEASMAGQSGSTRISAAFEQLSRAQSCQILYVCAGGTTPTQDDLSTPDKALAYLLNYASTVPGNESVYAAELWSYADLDGSPAGLASLMSRPRLNVESLSECSQAYTDVQGQARYALSQCQSIDAPADAIDKIQGVLSFLDKDLRTVREAWSVADDPTKIPSADTLLADGRIMPADYYRTMLDSLSAYWRSLVSYTDRLFLTGSAGSVSGCTSWGAHWWPTVQAGNPVALMLQPSDGAGGVIKNNSTVYLRSTEQKLSDTPFISGESGRNDLVYESRFSGSDEPKQQWILRKQGTSSDDQSPLRYGDSVAIVSRYWTDQQLCRDGDGIYMTTAKPPSTSPGAYLWTLQRAS